jgi:hypothetical protein
MIFGVAVWLAAERNIKAPVLKGPYASARHNVGHGIDLGQQSRAVLPLNCLDQLRATGAFNQDYYS